MPKPQCSAVRTNPSYFNAGGGGEGWPKGVERKVYALLLKVRLSLFAARAPLLADTTVLLFRRGWTFAASLCYILCSRDRGKKNCEKSR